MNCRVKNNQGLIGHVFDTGKPIAVQDILAEKRIVHSSMLVEEGIKSLVAVPIAIKNTRLGVILGYSTKKRFFTDNEINLLNTIARQAAGAIENARLYTFMHENFLNTIKALSAAIDTKDHYTHGHSKNVMDYSAYIAAELGLSPVEVEIIRFAGLLHDIGKIGVSESILSKKSGLNDDEFAIISTHPRLGAMIMDSVDFLKKISPIAYHHHERWDGRGYPMGLKGEDIPLGARIISVADAFDAITSKRSYSDAQDDDFGLREIIKCSGTQFDPKIVDAFVKVMDKKNRGVLQTIEEQPFLLTRELMKELA
jgi:putative nucleotidyltransferase with HDIG domain